MLIVNETVLGFYRGAGTCAWCLRMVSRREPHHVICRGHGGGKRLDTPLNLVALCGVFTGGDDCHGAAHSGKLSKDDLWPIIGRREHVNPAYIEEALWFILRLPRSSSGERIAEALRELDTGPRRLAKRVLKDAGIYPRKEDHERRKAS